MRKTFFATFFLASFFTAFLAKANEPQIAWTTVKDHQSLSEIIQNSASRGRGTILYFSVEWSVEANRTEKNLWIPKKGHEQFTFIKVDLSAWGDEEKLLVSQYGLSQEYYTPALVMLNSKGQEVKGSRLVGDKILTANAFDTWLRQGYLSLGTSSPTTARTTVVKTDSTGTPKIDEVDSIFAYDVSHKNSTIIAAFTIAHSYYMYRDKFKVAINGHVIPRADLRFIGTPHRHTNSAWGEQEVFENHVQVELDLDRNSFVICNPEAANKVELYYQGSSKAGIFYPPQKRTVQFAVSC